MGNFRSPKWGILIPLDKRLLARIREVHERNYCAYGYRRMWIALQREGEEVGRGRVQRLMRQAGIQGAKRRGKAWRTTKSDPLAHRRPDLVERDFSADGPNRLWVGDLPYLRCWEGNLFFVFIIDAFSRKVIGWALATHLRAELTLEALKMAIAARRPASGSLIHHSDRGVQYACRDYCALLTAHGIQPSMSRLGNPYDNAKAESFMKTLKKEEVCDMAYRDAEEARNRIGHFIQTVYNQQRLHSALDYLPPHAFETKLLSNTPRPASASDANTTDCPLF